VGALQVIRENGLQVPEDVALLGFDDVPISSALEPALTTVRQPIEQMGSMAADLLLNRLENPRDGPAPVDRIICRQSWLSGIRVVFRSEVASKGED